MLYQPGLGDTELISLGLDSVCVLPGWGLQSEEQSAVTKERCKVSGIGVWIRSCACVNGYLTAACNASHLDQVYQHPCSTGAY
jgi:hypothetical protein